MLFSGSCTVNKVFRPLSDTREGSRVEYLLDGKVQDMDVLFVDDDTNFLQLLERKADNSDLNAFTCQDPEKVKDFLEEEDIDCIVSDYKMSSMSGMELLEEIRQDNPYIPFIIFTGKGNEDLASNAISKGVTDYIVKDEGLTRFEVLENRVRNAVKNNRSEQMARGILDRVTDAFYSLDPDWKLTYINDEAEKLLQRSKDELMGENVWEEFPEAAESRLRIKYEEAMEKQKPVYFEEYYPPLETWFSVKAYPSETGLSVYFRDITGAKEREKQLQSRFGQQEATTELLRMALEEGDLVELQHSAAQMVAEKLGTDHAQVLKLEGRNQLTLAASHGMETLEAGSQVIEVDVDYPEGQALISNDHVVVEDFNTSDFERSAISFLNARSGLSVVIGEYDDSWGVLSTYSREARNYSRDEINFVQGIANVLGSALENQQQHLRLKEYKKVVNSVKDGILMIDNSQRIVMVNEAFSDMSGYDEDQLVGQKHTVIDGNMPESAQEIETKIETNDGQKLEVKTNLAPIKLPDGTTGRVAVVRPQEQD